MCQCPQRASTHFFGFKKMNISELEDMCQCPQRASTHFFKGWKVAMGNWKLCQCPQRASTHFFSYERCRTSKRKCVNALNGLLLISSVIGGTTEKNPFCVNALNGLLLISSYFTGWKAE